MESLNHYGRYGLGYPHKYARLEIFENELEVIMNDLL
jgi:hypothetical protein